MQDIQPSEQVFDTLEVGELFYNNYAHNVGFSVHSSTLTKDKNGVGRWKYFVCSKEGNLPTKKKDVEQSESSVKTRRKSLTWDWYNAKVVFKLTEEGKF